MPIIPTFFGIVIRIFYKEHEPPHFHADIKASSPSAASTGKSSRVTSGLGRRVP
jgi:hypothetical protein